MARKKKQEEADDTPVINVDAKQKATFVRRWAQVEQQFNSAKEERKDLLADLTVEIKSGYDQHGIDPKEVKRLASIYLDEQKHRDQADLLNSDLVEWDKVRKFDAELLADAAEDV